MIVKRDTQGKGGKAKAKGGAGAKAAAAPAGAAARFEKNAGPIDAALRRAAKVSVTGVLALKPGETVLIITNPEKDVQLISKAVYDAALEAGGKPTLVFQPTKSQLDFAEDAVISALRSEPDVILSISHQKLGKDLAAMKKPYRKGKGKKAARYEHVFNYLLGTKKSRSFWSPSVTLDMFRRTVPIDYAKMRKECAALKSILDRSDKVRVTAPGGTDLLMGIKGRKGHSDDGNFTKKGTGGNIPCGEVYISPELGATDGVIAFDGSMSVFNGVVVTKKPIVCSVKGGFVTKVTGGVEAKLLQDTIKKGKASARKMLKDGVIGKALADEFERNATNLGELGIGTNPKAKIVGNMLEDEKVMGTCHIAIGANYDEDAKALIHLDGLIRKPTMTAISAKGKETVFMKGGKFVL